MWEKRSEPGNKIVMFAKCLLNEHRKRNSAFFEASGSWRRRRPNASHDTSSNLSRSTDLCGKVSRKKVPMEWHLVSGFLHFNPSMNPSAFWCWKTRSLLQQLAEPEPFPKWFFPLVSEALEKKPSFLPLEPWPLEIRNFQKTSPSHLTIKKRWVFCEGSWPCNFGRS